MCQPADDEPPEACEGEDAVVRKVRRSLWISTLEGALTTVFLVWTTGSVLTGYMLHLGAGPPGGVVLVTDAWLTYVAIDPNGGKRPVPGL